MFRGGHREEKYCVVENTKHANTGQLNVLAQVHACLHTRARAPTFVAAPANCCLAASSGSSSQWPMVIHICFSCPGATHFLLEPGWFAHTSYLSHKALTEGAVPSPFSPTHRPFWGHRSSPGGRVTWCKIQHLSKTLLEL